jgi:hypothetical protein
MYELYTTMGKRRLLKIYESAESNGVYLNRFPNLEKDRTEVLHELSCDADKVGCFVDRDPSKAILNDIINAFNELDAMASEFFRVPAVEPQPEKTEDEDEGGDNSKN